MPDISSKKYSGFVVLGGLLIIAVWTLRPTSANVQSTKPMKQLHSPFMHTYATRSSAPRRGSRVACFSKIKKTKKTDLKQTGVNTVRDETIKANLQGRSRAMDNKGWKDPQGRQGRGYGVYRFAKKYGTNVDGYSPIYTPDIWAESGNEYKLGSQALAAWLILVIVLFALGANLIYTTSAL
mmetsp:Transcript_649/g.1144  ORF Transcript_649/g.1144 Transcript_649/m.1144 type:complete len:181 (+) Transcript_649:136-678(+)|eukprot:CAMPEP_0197527468 /NCGR_PEP_ID=MMETSP1318-20131121/21780_1 /TAXON_ID=552666 /ORGANISM="Partenskyella glossopodia, Strain RCC365" /LENGTH=180 /DNA_ID=CAMNT_0043082137 /DNA_START=58 /DNA_END=600 /DNA_ORIENTATION=+